LRNNNYRRPGKLSRFISSAKRGKNTLDFTGAFVGLCAQDMGGTRAIAAFDYFEGRTP
jgi:beta-xylosidase